MKQTLRIMLLVSLLVAASGVAAQQTVYKWVDEDGVIHFGESPPDGVTAERIVTDAAPPPQPAAPTISPQPQAAPQPSRPAAPKAVNPADDAPPPVSEVSLAELDARCDAAREAKIAPLREAEIENCKAQPRSDPNFCEQFNADFGDGGRTLRGAVRPRMFDDLPECVQALEERNRRGQ